MVISGKDADHFSNAYPVWWCLMNELCAVYSDKQWWILGYEVKWLYFEGLGEEAGSRDLWQSFWVWAPPPPINNTLS